MMDKNQSTFERRKKIREYYQRPEVKQKAKEYKQRPEVKQKAIEYRQRPENKQKAIEYRQRLEVNKKSKQYMKKYYQIPENKKKAMEYNRTPEAKKIKNKRNRKRRKIDKEYCIKSRLRCAFKDSFKSYIKGIIKQKSKKYNIAWTDLIESLKPFPDNIQNYHIDHIRPLSSFTFIKEDGQIDLQEIKKAWCPENLQWLTAEENLKKGSMWNGNIINTGIKQ